MRALTALCDVYCVVGAKQAQPWQTGLRLRDKNATMTSRSRRAAMILVVSAGVNGRWFPYGFRKLPMDQYARGRTILPIVCNFTKHDNSERHQYELQYNAKQGLILISKKKLFDIPVI